MTATEDDSMADMREPQHEAQVAQDALRQAEDTLYARKNRLRSKQAELARAQRRGEAGIPTVQQLQSEIRGLEAQIEDDLRTLGAARADLAQHLERFPRLNRPWELVEGVGDHLPFLLFPVRLETRFMTVDGGRQLWVRMFPDDIAVHAHETTLTDDEVTAGKTYWRERWAATLETEEAIRQRREKVAWRALAEAYGGTRAAWIASETRPDTLDVSSVDALTFPTFDPESLKAESWSRAPRSDVMPDCFVVMTFSEGREIHPAGRQPHTPPADHGPRPTTAGGGVPAGGRRVAGRGGHRVDLRLQPGRRNRYGHAHPAGRGFGRALRKSGF